MLNSSRVCVRTVSLCTRNMTTYRKASYLKWRDTMNTVEGERAARNMTNMLDVEEVNTQWLAAGYNARAPEHIKSHGTLTSHTLLHHYSIFRHVFNKVEFRPAPMTVTYNDRDVVLGTIITPTMAASPPQVSWNAAPDTLYTLVMLSPDDHPNDAKSELLHWCVVNIPGSDLDKGTAVASYVPPVPLKGTGYSREVVVVLEQGQELDTTLLNVDNTLEGRTIFLSHMIQDLSLTPHSVRFYQCMWDTSVGLTLARDLDSDEVQYALEQTKSLREHAAEEKYMYEEWKNRTSFM